MRMRDLGRSQGQILTAWIADAVLRYAMDRYAETPAPVSIPLASLSPGGGVMTTGFASLKTLAVSLTT